MKEYTSYNNKDRLISILSQIADAIERSTVKEDIAPLLEAVIFLKESLK